MEDEVERRLAESGRQLAQSEVLVNVNPRSAKAYQTAPTLNEVSGSGRDTELEAKESLDGESPECSRMKQN